MKSLAKPLTILLLVASSSCGSLPNAPTNAPAQPQETFSRLKSLVGTWKRAGAAETDTFRINFTLTANETVLVETWQRGDHPHSLTLYHADRDRLLATHYCPQGNQPRLQLTNSDAENTIAFEFLDATGLKGPDHSRQTALAFEFSGAPDSLIRAETYTSSESVDESSLHLVRDLLD